MVPNGRAERGAGGKPKSRKFVSRYRKRECEEGVALYGVRSLRLCRRALRQVHPCNEPAQYRHPSSQVRRVKFHLRGKCRRCEWQAQTLHHLQRQGDRRSPSQETDALFPKRKGDKEARNAIHRPRSGSDAVQVRSREVRAERERGKDGCRREGREKAAP